MDMTETESDVEIQAPPAKSVPVLSAAERQKMSVAKSNSPLIADCSDCLTFLSKAARKYKLRARIDIESRQMIF